MVIPRKNNVSFKVDIFQDSLSKGAFTFCREKSNARFGKRKRLTCSQVND